MCLAALPALLIATSVAGTALSTASQINQAEASHQFDKDRVELNRQKQLAESTARAEEAQIQFQQILESQVQTNETAVQEKGDIADEARQLRARVAASQAGSGLQIGVGSNRRILTNISFQASENQGKVEKTRSRRIQQGEHEKRAASNRAKVQNTFNIIGPKPTHGLTIAGGVLGGASSALGIFRNNKSLRGRTIN